VVDLSQVSLIEGQVDDAQAFGQVGWGVRTPTMATWTAGWAMTQATAS
jgi:hypothetical protein